MKLVEVTSNLLTDFSFQLEFSFLSIESESLPAYPSLSFLSKKENNRPHIPKLRLQKSIDSNGNELDPNDLVFAKNALRGTRVPNKDKRVCSYNFANHTCHCGMTLAKLKAGEPCHLKNRK